ncbi:MAG: hypothetical protein AB1730_25470 [Myxococcota bacterium]
MRTLLALLVLAAALSPAAAAACDCVVAEPEPAQAFAAAAVVVDGVVIRSSGGRFVIEVNRTFKGTPAPRVTVHTEASDCGYRFAPGERVVVYAPRVGGRLEVAQCRAGARVRWGTAAVDAEVKALLALGDGGR